jgi:hypothetical protein
MGEPDYDANYECAGAKFRLYNETDHPVVVDGKERNFQAVDNLGRSWDLYMLTSSSKGCGPLSFIFPDHVKESIPPGGDLKHYSRGVFIAFKGYLTDRNVEYVDFIIDGLSSFAGATWRVPVYH